MGFLADSSAELVSITASTSALVNSARRSLWLKTWSGDAASKLRPCGLLLTGDRLFGPGLQEALERTAEKRPFQGIRKSRLPECFFVAKVGSKVLEKGTMGPKNIGQGKCRGGVLFNPAQQPAKPQRLVPPSGRKIEGFSPTVGNSHLKFIHP